MKGSIARLLLWCWHPKQQIAVLLPEMQEYSSPNNQPIGRAENEFQVQGLGCLFGPPTDLHCPLCNEKTSIPLYADCWPWPVSGLSARQGIRICEVSVQCFGVEVCCLHVALFELIRCKSPAFMKIS